MSLLKGLTGLERSLARVASAPFMPESACEMAKLLPSNMLPEPK